MLWWMLLPVWAVQPAPSLPLLLHWLELLPYHVAHLFFLEQINTSAITVSSRKKRDKKHTIITQILTHLRANLLAQTTSMIRQIQSFKIQQFIDYAINMCAVNYIGGLHYSLHKLQCKNLFLVLYCCNSSCLN